VTEQQIFFGNILVTKKDIS